MKNKIILFVFMLVYQTNFGQIDLEQNLINSIANYKNNKQENLEDDYWKKVNNSFRILIEDKNIQNFEFQNLKKHCDTIMFSFDKFETSDNKIIAYCLKRPSFLSGLNYICVKTKTNFKIIYEDLNSVHQFFSGIESLDNNKFLLFETQYDLAFGCNYATVFEYKNKKIKIINAFSNRKKLTVCNFTSTIGPSVFDKDGKVIGVDEFKSQPIIKIEFDKKSKILYFLNNTKSAKYIDGKFKINDYDERKMLD